MSHFTVLVIGDNIEKKLAPYDENLEVEPYDDKCYCIGISAHNKAYDQAQSEIFQKNPILEDILNNLQKKYEEEKEKAKVSSDAREEARFNVLHNKPSKAEAIKEFCRGLDKITDGKGDTLWKEYIKREEELFNSSPDKSSPNPNCKECEGTGIIKSTYNPISKWDWYQIGGRWFGNFVLKDGINPNDKLRQGEPSWGWEPQDIAKVVASKRVDQALFKEINWEKTQSVSEEEIEKANSLWDWVEGKLTEEEARNKGIFNIYKKSYYTERYGTREKYIQRKGLFVTYAIITEDGKWHEQGEMGYFGMSSETNEEANNWQDIFWDTFIKTLSPETLLTVVDCHI